jgi:hypothetical protein
MNRQILLFRILLIFLITACSSEDNSSNENIKINKLFKKSESYSLNADLISDITVNYNSENKIKSIIKNNFYDNTNKSISVNYSQNIVTSIIEINSSQNFLFSETITYNVTIENNKISLIDSDELTGIEIYYENGYVNSMNRLQVPTLGVFSEETFTRDSNQNLVSSTQQNGTINFVYSNFDSEKMTNPLNTLFTDLDPLYINIFDLKLTNSNPLSMSGYYDNENDIFPLYNGSFEYDEYNYVIKRTSDEHPEFVQDYQYIEI